VQKFLLLRQLHTHRNSHSGATITSRTSMREISKQPNYQQDARRAYASVGLFRLLGWGDFEFFLPRRGDRYVAQLGWNLAYDSSTPNFARIGPGNGAWSQNCKFYEISEHKRPAGAYLLHDSYDEIFRVCGPYCDGSIFWIWWD